MMSRLESTGRECWLGTARDCSIEPTRIRERLVNPSVEDFGRSSGVSLEAISVNRLQNARQGCSPTPWGMSRLVWSSASILRWEFEDKSVTASRIGPAEQGLPVDDVGARDRVESLVAALKDPTASVSVSIDGTPFQQRVWRALLSVPRGSVTSYGRLADAVGCRGAARAVGAACAANPVALIIPCHRVVSESGGLNGYRWGIGRKAQLLIWEFEMESPTAPVR